MKAQKNSKWKKDLLPGFILFLIALPLSLGIAMASGVPPIARLFAAIVGGMLVSRLSGGYVSINGPAAGLIVVILHGVESLGQGNALAGYRLVLAAVVLSGVLLAVFGKLKAGMLGDLFPTSAVHGMLSAIGVIIIAKQIHTALGLTAAAKTTVGLLAEIPHSLLNLNPEVFAIGGSSLLLLIGLPLLRNRWISRIPVPMVVILVGMALGRYFDLEHEHVYLFRHDHPFVVGPKLLVTLPAQIVQGITLPDFSQILSGPFLSLVFSLTLIQGLETLLSASAVDRFDPLKRSTDLNRDLFAVGVGSAVSGAIGGLPIIAEIVRSRANVSSGAQTQWSNFFHGAFMLIFVMFFPGLIHQIPLASLAAILIVTGYRLASPSQFKHTLEIGRERFLVFVTTLITTVCTDLLIGIGVGIALEIALHFLRGAPVRTFLKPNLSVSLTHDTLKLTLRDGAIFTNFLGIKKALRQLPSQGTLILDVSHAKFIDHTVMERLTYFSENWKNAGGKAQWVGLHKLKATSHHPLASRRRTLVRKSRGSVVA